MRIGEYIKLKRSERKLSLRQVAYKTGLSHTYIADIEKGNLIGTNETHEKIMTGLNFNEKEKNHFYDLLFEDEALPKHINEKIKRLEFENEKLKEELKKCKKQMSAENRSNSGHIIVGDGNKINTSYIGNELFRELSELNEKEKEKVLKFINDYIKN